MGCLFFYKTCCGIRSLGLLACGVTLLVGGTLLSLLFCCVDASAVLDWLPVWVIEAVVLISLYRWSWLLRYWSCSVVELIGMLVVALLLVLCCCGLVLIVCCGVLLVVLWCWSFQLFLLLSVLCSLRVFRFSPREVVLGVALYFYVVSSSNIELRGIRYPLTPSLFLFATGWDMLWVTCLDSVFRTPTRDINKYVLITEILRWVIYLRSSYLLDLSTMTYTTYDVRASLSSLISCVSFLCSVLYVLFSFSFPRVFFVVKLYHPLGKAIKRHDFHTDCQNSSRRREKRKRKRAVVKTEEQGQRSRNIIIIISKNITKLSRQKNYNKNPLK